MCEFSGDPFIIKEKGATAWVDGNNLLGPVVGNYCMKLAINKAKEHGIGWVVTKNSNHFGIAGWYAEMAVNQGMIVSLENNCFEKNDGLSKIPRHQLLIL